MTSTSRMSKQNRDFPRVPRSNSVWIGIKHTPTRKSGAQAMQIMLKMISDQNGGASCFLNNVVKRADLRIVNLLPLFRFIRVDGAISNLQALLRLACRFQRFDRRRPEMPVEFQEHLLFHIPILRHRFVRQLHFDHVANRLFQIEVVFRIERQAYVADQRFYLALGVRQYFKPESVIPLPKPALRESCKTFPEPLAA